MDLIWNNKRVLSEGLKLIIKPTEIPSVTIGTQTWMLKNASYNVSGSRVYANNPVNETEYGRLYTYNMIPDIETAYPGWHVPSQTEWETLFSYVGGGAIAAQKLKETGTTHWTPPNTFADNTYGFTALPGGYYSGSYTDLEVTGIWLSDTIVSANNCYLPYCQSPANMGNISGNISTFFASVRLLKN